MRAASRKRVSTSYATVTGTGSDQPSASTAPSPPSVVAEPPTPTRICVAPAAAADAISSPVPRVVAATGSFDSPTSARPLARAISTTAVPSGRSPHSACTGSPSGPVTIAGRRSPPSAARSASSVPSPPSANGSTRTSSTPASHSPRAIAVAAAGAVSVPLNLSGQQTARGTGGFSRYRQRGTETDAPRRPHLVTG